MPGRSRLRDGLSLVAKGFCMGAADVVPGVSGGTMAFILGIYTRLIDAIKSFDGGWVAALLKFELRTVLTRPHFSFLIPLGAGIFSAIAFFTHVVPIPRLLHTCPENVYGLFFGLIVGSIVMLIRTLDFGSLADIGGSLIGVVIGGIVVTAVPSQTPDTWWFIMASGAIAICAMVLPGISGSFILLILGKYAYVLDGIGKLEFDIIIPFAAGAALGLAVFTRLLSWLLHRFERTMLLVISGFLVASLWVIWPFQHRHYITVRGKQRLIDSTPISPPWNLDTAEAVLFMGIGLIAVLAVTRFANHRGM